LTPSQYSGISIYHYSCTSKSILSCISILNDSGICITINSGISKIYYSGIPN